MRRKRRVATQQRRGKMIIAVSNQKGGVAKTTTCLALGATLAGSGSRVLIGQATAPMRISAKREMT